MMPDGTEEMMHEINEELMALQKEIDAAKNEDAAIGGQIQAHLQRLKEDFNANDLKAAEKMKSKEMIMLEDLETELISKFKKLKETYEW